MRSLHRTIDRATLRDIALVCAADALVGASFGAIATAGGLPAWLPIALSLLVFAGGAQFAALGVVLAGGSALAAVATGLVLNARLLLFGFALSDVVGGRWTRYLGAHLIMDEALAFTLRRRDPAGRRAVFRLCGLALFACWNLAVAAGALAGRSLHSTDALGLDAAFPAVLLALIFPALAAPAVRKAAALGAAAAVAAAPFLPAGLPVLLAPLALLLFRPARTEAAR
ncbi:AzlC family ABC transporter permease [Actinomadura parmotrematis]|uniref:AzlC family ABC transporter permease n=1 Tax=Actinomadura parmotrematis TaxID=2864039 RepID=A0ABS7FZT9_9ACTN|nr:AzlC family ABC transporter permease [Actinomadura parmotrematis]MBW8485082.1 AzlC family ABC transporter permease [Actinomadura parmotrematis]